MRIGPGPVAVVALLLGGAAAVAGCGGSPTARRAAPATTTLPALRGDEAATTSQLGPWHLVGHTSVFGPLADEGVATIDGRVHYTGDLSVTGALATAGWDHVGDLDADGADLIEPFQAGPGATSKLFVTVAPDGSETEAVHPLAEGESPANSFVAVAPGGRWMVAGEYGTEHRFLILAVPDGATADLPLAGDVELDRPLVDVQGCAFATATALICDSDDPAAGDPVAEVDLAGPLAGRSVDASVTDLGDAPRVSRCRGAFEPEGVDVDRSSGVLRLEVVSPPPCSATVTVYAYRR